ncbi:Epoxide hydrolase A [Linum grandiflorum]
MPPSCDCDQGLGLIILSIILTFLLPILLANIFYQNNPQLSHPPPTPLPNPSAAPMDGITHRTLSLNGINLHVAESGPKDGPVILFLHGFPQLWYCWRHQIIAMASLGYRTVAPDLRGFGDSDAPSDPESYTAFHVVGDLVALIDAVAPQDRDGAKVFVVAHDWGAYMAWYLCLLRPDKVKAMVALSVPFSPRNPNRKPIPSFRAFLGDDYYICRIQEAGEMEAEFAEMGTERVVKEFLTYHKPAPLYLPKGNLFGNPANTPIPLPPWLSEQDVKYYTDKYEKTGFTGGFKVVCRNWELSAAWTGMQIKVPVKFIVGDQDLTYNTGNARDYISKGGMKKDVPFLQEVVVMEGVGHFINEERPDDITNHIADFFCKF